MLSRVQGAIAMTLRWLGIICALAFALSPARADFGNNAYNWNNPYVLTMDYVTSSTSTTGSVTAPASIENGDLLILFDSSRASSGFPTAVTPTGFTNLSSVAGNANGRNMLSYKIADGTEDSASITGMDSTEDRKCLVQYRGSRPISNLTASTPVTASSAGDPTQQTIAASSGVLPPTLGIATFSANNTVSPRTTSITPDNELSCGSVQAYFHGYTQETSPANYTFDMDDEGNDNILIGVYFYAFW